MQILVKLHYPLINGCKNWIFSSLSNCKWKFSRNHVNDKQSPYNYSIILHPIISQKCGWKKLLMRCLIFHNSKVNHDMKVTRVESVNIWGKLLVFLKRLSLHSYNDVSNVKTILMSHFDDIPYVDYFISGWSLVYVVIIRIPSIHPHDIGITWLMGEISWHQLQHNYSDMRNYLDWRIMWCIHSQISIWFANFKYMMLH